MSNSMKPRARSGARARLLLPKADGVSLRVAIGRLCQLRVSQSGDLLEGRVDNIPGRTDNTATRPGDKLANTTWSGS